MTARRRLAFWSLVGLQALVPLALIAWNEVALARGTEVRLKTAPVDPYDLFRGRYVRLRYEISRLPVRGRAAPGDVVYVPLHDVGDRWTGEAATTRRPASGTFVRGRLSEGGLIEYGIETYYADEAEARRLEREVGELYVDVVLDDDGRARISRLER